MESRKYSKGEVIFFEDIIEAIGFRFIYQVKSGAVDIIVNFETPEQKKLTTLKPGAYFGEIALIEGCPHSATAIAAEDCEVNLITDYEFFDVAKKDPKTVVELVKNLGIRIRSLTNDYMEVCKTLKEYGANESVGEKSGSLWKRLLKFSTIYTKNGKKVSDVKPELNRGTSLNWIGDNATYFDHNEIIFKEGEDSHCMYYIISGDVGIYASYGMKDQKLVTTLTGGQFFGEIGLVGNDVRSASAVALKNGATLDRILLNGLEDLVTKNPEKINLLLVYLSNRLRTLTYDYLKACKTAAEVIKASEDGDDLTLTQAELLKFYTEMEILGNFCY